MGIKGGKTKAALEKENADLRAELASAKAAADVLQQTLVRFLQTPSPAPAVAPAPLVGPFGPIGPSIPSLPWYIGDAPDYSSAAGCAPIFDARCITLNTEPVRSVSHLGSVSPGIH